MKQIFYLDKVTGYFIMQVCRKNHSIFVVMLNEIKHIVAFVTATRHIISFFRVSHSKLQNYITVFTPIYHQWNKALAGKLSLGWENCLRCRAE